MSTSTTASTIASTPHIAAQPGTAQRALAAANHARGPAANRARTGPLCYLVSITTADGASITYRRLGGSSIEHTMEAMHQAGLGGVVRVTVCNNDDTPKTSHLAEAAA